MGDDVGKIGEGGWWVEKLVVECVYECFGTIQNIIIQYNTIKKHYTIIHYNRLKYNTVK